MWLVPDRGARAHHPAPPRRELHRLRDPPRRARLGPGGARRLRRLRRRRPGSGRRRARGVRVTALWSQVYAEPAARARVVAELPFLAEVPVAGTTGGFARLRGGGYVPRPHLAPVRPATGWPRPSASSACPTSGAGAAPAASTARRWCSSRSSPPAARRRATPTCRRRCSARELAADAAPRARRPRVLEGPRRDHAGRGDAPARQRPPHGGGERAARARRRPDRGGGRRPGHPPPAASRPRTRSNSRY